MVSFGYGKEELERREGERRIASNSSRFNGIDRRVAERRKPLTAEQLGTIINENLSVETGRVALRPVLDVRPGVILWGEEKVKTPEEQATDKNHTDEPARPTN